MKERPIPFQNWGLRAILDGTKTMTRRPMRKQPPEETIEFRRGVTGLWTAFDGNEKPVGFDLYSPYGESGDVLWVRETWGIREWFVLEYGEQYRAKVEYRVDGQILDRIVDAEWFEPRENNLSLRADQTSWLPPRFMPRWASRIDLLNEKIRPQRLHDITEEEAKKEGVKQFPYEPCADCWTDGKYKTSFEYHWNQMYGWNPNAWSMNDWVWAIEFRRIKP